MDMKRHLDTVAVIITILGAMVWMNGKFNSIERDVAVIKAVLVMKQIMPTELAAKKE